MAISGNAQLLALQIALQGYFNNYFNIGVGNDVVDYLVENTSE